MQAVTYRLLAGLALLAVMGCSQPAPAAEPAGSPSKGPDFSASDKFYIKYKVADAAGAGVAAIEVWFSSDGGRNWQKFATDEKLAGKVVFKAPGEGTYSFVTVAVDRAGNRETTPEGRDTRAFSVTVDCIAPKVAAKGPAGDWVGKPGASIEYSWKAEDLHLVPEPVSLQLKLEGQDKWQDLAKGLPAEGKQAITLPDAKEGRGEVRVLARDRAGNVGSAVAGTIVFDGLPPKGRVTGPKVAFTLVPEVSYEVSDQGPAGVASASVWITADKGKTWKKFADGQPRDATIKGVRLPGPGSYGLAVSAADRAGNVLSPPAAGAAPEFTASTDAAPPKVSLTEPKAGRSFSKNDSVAIRWTAADDNLGEKPVTIEFSSDGGATWSVLAEALANSGSHLWTPPALDSEKCLVRVRVADAVGNSSQAASQTFLLDNTPPSSEAGFEAIIEEVKEEDKPPAGPLPPPAGPAPRPRRR